MSDDLKVTVATPFDVHQIMDGSMSACEENGFVNVNPHKLLGEIWDALHLKNGLVGVIRGDDGILQGGILLRMGKMWYSDDTVLEEKAIFIHPDYRSARGGRARMLCEFAKHTADTLGIPLLIGVLSNHRTEGKVRLYERQFGTPSGAFFLYGARTGMPPEKAVSNG